VEITRAERRANAIIVAVVLGILTAFLVVLLIAMEEANEPRTDGRDAMDSAVAGPYEG
jgi:hypothetical protein